MELLPHRLLACLLDFCLAVVASLCVASFPTHALVWAWALWRRPVSADKPPAMACSSLACLTHAGSVALQAPS